MQLLGDAAALGQPGLELRLEQRRREPGAAPHNDGTNSPDQPGAGQCAEHAKPGRLVKGRLNAETPSSASLIPDTVVVARPYTEPVLFGRETAVVGLPAGFRITPFRIPAFELVPELDALRNRQAERRVIDLEVVDAVR